LKLRDELRISSVVIYVACFAINLGGFIMLRCLRDPRFKTKGCTPVSFLDSEVTGPILTIFAHNVASRYQIALLNQ